MALEVDVAAAAVADVRVELRGAEIGVAEHLLDAAEIGAAFEQMRGERVAQEVRVNALRLEARALRQAAQDQEGPGPRERAALALRNRSGRWRRSR